MCVSLCVHVLTYFKYAYLCTFSYVLMHVLLQNLKEQIVEQQAAADLDTSAIAEALYVTSSSR